MENQTRPALAEPRGPARWVEYRESRQAHDTARAARLTHEETCDEATAMPVLLLQNGLGVPVVRKVSEVRLWFRGLPWQPMPTKTKATAMRFKKMVERWQRYRRNWLALADDLEAIGDADAEMFRKMAGELQARIDHVKANKPPPVPDAPTCAFFVQTEAFHESLKMADFEARQRKFSGAERKDMR